VKADYPSTVAIITARGGSKGIPHKNVRSLAGRPLIAYTIEAALGCPYITNTYVTTDDRKIAEISSAFGASVIERPKHLATDEASSRDAVQHALRMLTEQGHNFEQFALLQPTSPLRTATHLTRCCEAFIHGKYASAFSVCLSEHHPWKMFKIIEGRLIPFEGREHLAARRQSLPAIFRQNGAIYLMRCRDFMTGDGFFAEPAMPFLMSSEESIDIDTELDFRLADMLLKQRQALR
jgi:N-acylneuraminate cytidylyltransferase/CMP-N,N'-diacetyllegionaminic acid synthase